MWEDFRVCFDIRVLPDLLERAGVSWKYYVTENAWNNALQAIRHIGFGPMWERVQPPAAFLEDVRNSDLPQVSWLVPPSLYEEHPGNGKSRCAGENWTMQQLNALMRSDHWRTTVVVVVWDDFGGFFDPVPPRTPTSWGWARGRRRSSSRRTRGRGTPARRIRRPHDLRVLLRAALHRAPPRPAPDDRAGRRCRPALGGAGLRASELRPLDPAAPDGLPVRARARLTVAQRVVQVRERDLGKVPDADELPSATAEVPP
jgi:hypothetical protein